MSARYDRGCCGTSLYQWLQPPWTTMSRSGASDVLVVSWEVTSNSRMIGFDPGQSWPSAASARCTDWTDSSQKAWSQNGSGAVRTMRSFTAPPLLPFADRSLSAGMAASTRTDDGILTTGFAAGSSIRAGGFGGRAAGLTGAGAGTVA